MKPVIFIPGFPASELYDATTLATLFPPPLPALLDSARKRAILDKLIVVPGDVKAGSPIASIAGGLVAEAQSIYSILRNQFGYDITPASRDFAAIGWDWRQGIAAQDTMKRIRKELDRMSPAQNGNVVAIVHSTGGLVLRAFLEAQPEYRACFEQVMAFGVPWAGTLESLHAMTRGSSIAFLFITLLAATDSARVVSHAQAAYDLMPRDPNLELFFDAFGNPSTPIADRDWMSEDYMRDLAGTSHTAFPREFDDLPVTNICGWGAKTWTTASVDPETYAIDFAPQDKEAGDGTVPFVSSSWLQGDSVRSMYLPIGAYATGFLPKIHGQLWDAPPVLQLFAEVLGGKKRMPFLCAAADSDDYIDYGTDVRVRVSAVAPDGEPLKDCVVKVNLGGKRTKVPLPDGKHATFVVSRGKINRNIEPDLYRFMVEFKWDGGQDKRAVLIHAV